MSDQHDWTVLLHLSLLRRICWDWPPCYQVAGRRGWWRRTARTEQTWRRPRTSARTRPSVLPRPRHPPHRWPSVSHTRNRKSELTRQMLESFILNITEKLGPATICTKSWASRTATPSRTLTRERISQVTDRQYSGRGLRLMWLFCSQGGWVHPSEFASSG